MRRLLVAGLASAAAALAAGAASAAGPSPGISLGWDGLLAGGRLAAGAIVYKRAPDEEMRGMPMRRVTSPDGAWAYTLYDTTRGGLFVHALDAAHRRAFCIDLPARVTPQSLANSIGFELV